MTDPKSGDLMGDEEVTDNTGRVYVTTNILSLSQMYFLDFFFQLFSSLENPRSGWIPSGWFPSVTSRMGSVNFAKHIISVKSYPLSLVPYCNSAGTVQRFGDMSFCVRFWIKHGFPILH